MNEDYAKKSRMARAISAAKRLRASGRDPATMTDVELLRDVRNLGRKSIPALRELVREGRQICPHCGLPVDMPNAESEERTNGDSLHCLVGRFEDGCMELEREITCGGHIDCQEMKWHVFKKCGCSVNAGAGTLCELILSLAPNASNDASAT